MYEIIVIEYHSLVVSVLMPLPCKIKSWQATHLLKFWSEILPVFKIQKHGSPTNRQRDGFE